MDFERNDSTEGGATAGEWRERYPIAEQEDVVDSYHGVDVRDPYRWLEDGESERVEKWVAAQNAISESFLRRTPPFEGLRARFEELMNYERYSLPTRKGNRYFLSRNDGLQNQAVQLVQESLQSEPVELLDPNTLSSDGTIALTGMSVDPEGKRLAYALSTAGSDSQIIRIRDVATRQDYPETLEWCRFTTVAWAPDGTGFYYNRYPAPHEAGYDPSAPYSSGRVCWHTLDTPQSEDAILLATPDRNDLNFVPIVTDDGAFLALHVWRGSESRNRFYYRELGSDGDFVRLLDKGDAAYNFIGNVGRKLYFITDLDAPHGKVIAIDVDRPEPEQWEVILPESDAVVTRAVLAGGRLVVVRMRHAYDTVTLHDVDGGSEQRLGLPEFGTIFQMTGDSDQSELFLGFTSFLHPATNYRYDLETGELTTLWSARLGFDASLYRTEQIFFPSKDGTEVPMFVICRADIALDGSNPAILYGYGGFGNSMTPGFSSSWLLWLDIGGVVAIANLRGGGEYGEEWHKAGTLERKQNTFDDFIAAAEALVARRYTSNRRLAIMGGSNGGLLVAACMIQRPELFGAVICQVPVIDMLRYHRFTVGHFWIPEYGNAESDVEQFNFLLAYSPLHNIDPDASYPPILIHTADHDDRVDPAHSRKFAAALQAASHGHAPVLLRVETRAGHGAGKPIGKVIDDQAETFSFLMQVFGMTGDGETAGRRDGGSEG
jgi:prolyl oligopeptidase